MQLGMLQGNRKAIHPEDKPVSDAGGVSSERISLNNCTRFKIHTLSRSYNRNDNVLEQSTLI